MCIIVKKLSFGARGQADPEDSMCFLILRRSQVVDWISLSIGPPLFSFFSLSSARLFSLFV